MSAANTLRVAFVGLGSMGMGMAKNLIAKGHRVIGVDTNILVRLLTGDDPAQVSAAERFVTTQLSPERCGFVSMVVVCELAWTLEVATHSGAARSRTRSSR